MDIPMPARPAAPVFYQPARGERMKLLFLIGNSAVGKMTVGQELMKITGLRLFHNHMTIEPVLEVFGRLDFKTVSRLRDVIFEDFAASDLEGMIFTFMWAFDMPSDWEYATHVRGIFEKHGAGIYYAELVAQKDERMRRNMTENRMTHKASKRDTEASNARLLRDDGKYRLESFDGELPFENYIKIDNTDLPADKAAGMIKRRFGL